MATQQMFLGGGKPPTKRYTDQVFHSWAYEGGDGYQVTGVNSTDPDGNNVTRTLWFKKRNSAQDHYWFDSDRGHWSTGYKYLKSNYNDAEVTANSNYFTGSGFQSAGWVPSGYLTTSGDRYVNWCFQEAPGFFDTVKYTGTGNNLTISHNLGCMPGFVMVKSLDYSDYWTGFHCFDYSHHQHLVLTNSSSSGWSYFVQEPTKDEIYIKNNSIVNTNGKEYIAYIWGGGPSRAGEAKSLYWSTDSHKLTCGNASNTTADFNFGTGDLTIECWIRCNGTQDGYPRVVAIGPQWEAGQAALQWDHTDTANKVTFYCYNYSSSGPLLESATKDFNGDGRWHHCAVTRSGNSWRLFVDGILEATNTWTGSPNSANSYVNIGNHTAATAHFSGYISNVRIVKGTAVYTSTFRVPTQPLTNVTNTKLLCCNSSSITGATVTPITLAEVGLSNPTSESPFKDPDGFKFGDSQEDMINCGSYEGNGSNDGPEIELGWEPQWIMIKAADAYQNWLVWDNTRGITSDDSTVSDPMLYPNLSNSESSGIYRMRLTSTGFKLTSSNAEINTDNQTYIFVAIRRPDPKVAAAVTVGTKAFAMDTGNSSGKGARGFDTTFPVDFGTTRRHGTGDNWYTSARLINGREVQINSNGAASSQSNKAFDSNRGWHTSTGIDSNFLSWMWGRHKGFDCVTYTGNGSGRQLRHNMTQIPEMIWTKRLDSSGDWHVYHSGMNGGSSPANYYMRVNSHGEQTNTAIWNETPTADWFAVSSDGHSNTNNAEYLALLFSSVTDISKCGYYTGNGTSSSSTQTITTGFQPRFVIIKCSSHDEHWMTFDTTRGWASGSDDPLLELGQTGAQDTTLGDIGHPISTGFVIKNQYAPLNLNNHKYIYYAHA